MDSRWRHRLLAAAVCVGLLLVGFGQADVGRADLGEPIVYRAASGNELGQPNGALPVDSDVTELIDRALAARVVNDVDFAALVRAAGTACPDPGAARRLGDVAAMAARWSSAVQDGRPKAQAVAEAQLDTVDWDGLLAACVGAS